MSLTHTISCVTLDAALRIAASCAALRDSARPEKCATPVAASAATLLPGPLTATATPLEASFAETVQMMLP